MALSKEHLSGEQGDRPVPALFQLTTSNRFERCQHSLTLAGLHRTDPRVGAWAGTAHGVLQAFQQPPAAPKLPLPLDG